MCTHSSAHSDLSSFRGQSVIVIGAGQSALESAALLHENGATVQVVARKSRVAWNGTPLALDRPLLQRLREPEAGLGSGWSTWFYSEHPSLFRHLPKGTRIYRSRTALGPAGASWLRARAEGQFPLLTSHVLKEAEATGAGVSLDLRHPGPAAGAADRGPCHRGHGYRPDLSRLSFLSPGCAASWKRWPGLPWSAGITRPPCLACS